MNYIRISSKTNSREDTENRRLWRLEFSVRSITRIAGNKRLFLPQWLKITDPSLAPKSSSQFVASSTWCELFGSWSFCWSLCYRVSYIQCPKIPLQARIGTVGGRVSRSTHARLANVQKVKHGISISASKWLNRHFLWRQKFCASEIEEGRIILISESN